MPIQELIDKLQEVGKQYPPAPSTFFERLKFWNKHYNQPAAAELQTIGSVVTPDAPEQLQQAQLLLGLVNVLNAKTFVSSTLLMTGIKKALSEYEPFQVIDAYLPLDSNKECPKIQDLREALSKYGDLLRAKYELEQSTAKATNKY